MKTVKQRPLHRRGVSVIGAQKDGTTWLRVTLGQILRKFGFWRLVLKLKRGRFVQWAEKATKAGLPRDPRVRQSVALRYAPEIIKLDRLIGLGTSRAVWGYADVATNGYHHSPTPEKR